MTNHTHVLGTRAFSLLMAVLLAAGCAVPAAAAEPIDDHVTPTYDEA